LGNTTNLGDVTDIENDGIVGSFKSIHVSKYTIWLNGKWSWNEIHQFKQIVMDVIDPFYSDAKASVLTTEVIVMTFA
jgi:hypothetical protein